MRKLSLVGIQQGYPREKDSEKKSKVSIVDTEIYKSGLRVSNTRVFSSD